MAWEIYAACSDGEAINAHTYVLLSTVIDVDGLFDLLEMQTVHSSWQQAIRMNLEEQHGNTR